jgi:hypothetical protein
MAISALDEMVNSAHASDEMVYCAPTDVAGADEGRYCPFLGGGGDR